MNNSTRSAEIPDHSGESTARPVGRDLPDYEDLRTELSYERDRRAAVAAAIREQLEEQPSPRTVRSAAHRWSQYCTQLGEDIAAKLEEARK